MNEFQCMTCFRYFCEHNQERLLRLLTFNNLLTPMDKKEISIEENFGIYGDYLLAVYRCKHPDCDRCEDIRKEMRIVVEEIKTSIRKETAEEIVNEVLDAKWSKGLVVEWAAKKGIVINTLSIDKK